MKPILLALAAALAAGPAMAAVQNDPVVARQAEAFRSIVGRESPDGAVIRSVEAQGRALVIRATIPDSYTFPVEEAAKAFSDGMCQDSDGAAFFREGRTVRVEMTPQQGPVRVGVQDHCPAPEPAS